MGIKPTFRRKDPRNKYGAKKKTIGGIKFDSGKEARRWTELQLLERAGQISDLQRQVKIELMGQYRPLLTRTGRKMKITIDFAYIENGERVFEETKGMPTRDYEVRIAALRAMGIEVRET